MTASRRSRPPLATLAAAALAACGGSGAPLPAPVDDGLVVAPSIDLFVVRGPETGARTGVERFRAYQDQEPSQYLPPFFQGDAAPAVSAFLEQAGVTAHAARVRIFYIRLDAARVDLATVAQDFAFALTDGSGLADKGTVYRDPATTFNVLLAGDAVPSLGYTGVANLPGHEVLMVSDGPGFAGGAPAVFGRVLAHELGHDLGLVHAFDSASCQWVSEYSSNRVMDYAERMDVFVPCERVIARSTAGGYLGLAAAAHDAAAAPALEIYDGQWEGQRTVGTPRAAALAVEAAGPSVLVRD